MADTIDTSSPQETTKNAHELTPVAQEGLKKLKNELRTLSPEQKRIRTEELIKGTAEEDRLLIIKELRRAELFGLKESKNPKMKKITEILKNRNSFEDMNVADILTLRSAGIPLYSYLLIQKKESHKEVTADTLQE